MDEWPQAVFCSTQVVPSAGRSKQFHLKRFKSSDLPGSSLAGLSDVCSFGQADQLSTPLYFCLLEMLSHGWRIASLHGRLMAMMSYLHNQQRLAQVDRQPICCGGLAFSGTSRQLAPEMQLQDLAVHGVAPQSLTIRCPCDGDLATDQ